MLQQCVIREIAASLRSDDEPSTEEEIIVHDHHMMAMMLLGYGSMYVNCCAYVYDF